MPRDAYRATAGGPDLSDEAYQEQMLLHVSRTFALTIPELPPGLRGAVTSAYLLCRIADTIEDEPTLSPGQTYSYLQRFAAVVAGTEAPAPLALEIEPLLSEHTLPAERDLVRNLERVIRMTLHLNQRQRAAIQRCIELMCDGMHRFQRTASVRGLERMSDLDSYCYYVAGVVGEMLTELFCDHSAAIGARRAALRELATSFAQGLQMTNILKDQWEDRSRGACWLPRELFLARGIELEQLVPGASDERFAACLRELVGVAHAHLRNAMAYALLIPPSEAGIRRFCLWAVGLAVLTLQRIERNPRFAAGAEVKISHAAVALTCASTNLAVRSNAMLSRLFDWAARGLPLAPPAEVRRGSRAAAAAAQLLTPLEPYVRDTRDGRMTPALRTSDGGSLP